VPDKKRGGEPRQQECREAQLAAWKSFMQAQLQLLQLRKEGQLGRLLGEPLPGEAPAVTFCKSPRPFLLLCCALVATLGRGI
jgi:hypothetical protein